MSDLKLPEGETRAVIFDCDGTLADTMPLHYRAWKYAYEKNGAKFEFTWDLFYSMAGVGMHHSVELINEKYQETLDVNQVVEDNHDYIVKEHHAVEPIIPVAELARQFKAEGLHIAVASGGDPRHVHGTLKYCGIDDLFEVVVTKADVVHSKPAPDGFLKAAELLGVEPQYCVVYEDSKLGLQAAEAAGMRWVYVDPDKYSVGG
ncbi:HAD family hydrolase [Cerasicoccus fimbriatus]|uniref:HAD family hydrolase n=1 Tax=Cerasicoccus fimbriatus TaxID=3014554 RepID=UPI0022B2F743|nr:HAD family phosphatase [Cerasicoccus sp. TK19100]